MCHLEKLKDVKDSCPVELAELAIKSGEKDKQEFVYCAPCTIKISIESSLRSNQNDGMKLTNVESEHQEI